MTKHRRNINYEKPVPQVDLYFRANRKWDHLKNYTTDYQTSFSVIDSLGIQD